MKVVHFGAGSPGLGHIHSHYSTSCFYIPEKEALLCASTSGTFSETTYSICDYEPLINNAKAITEGKKPEQEGITFSIGKVFDYDEKELTDLIEIARYATDSNAKLTAGMKKLSYKVREKKDKIKGLDPSTLDITYKARLENIVGDYVANDEFKFRFNKQMGYVSKKESEVERIKGYYENFCSRNEIRIEYNITPNALDIMREAKEKGLEEIAMEIAKKVSVSNDYNLKYKDRLEAAKIAGTEEEAHKIAKVILFECMSQTRGHYLLDDYIEAVEEKEHGISYEEARQLAQDSCPLLINQGSNDYNEENLVKAAQLSKKYGLEIQLGKANEKLINKMTKMLEGKEHTPQTLHKWRELEGYGISPEQLKPLMIKFFPHNLDPEIPKRFGFDQNEVEEVVTNQFYQELRYGSFERALKIKKDFDGLVNSTITDKELEDLIGIMNHGYKEIESD